MSTSNAQDRASKKQARRPYRLGKRADRQQETRRRIVEAAVDLHSSLGPARTTVAQIAERAGVQRHTYYAHFPDERSLFLACSGLALERDPLPDVTAWRSLPPGRERLRKGLAELYGWFERNAEQSACVLRDAQHHALTREIVELRMMPTFASAAQVLGAGLGQRSTALLMVALDFGCWRALGQPSEAAADLMSEAICALG
jgi:AcrR family transcriptional regulator